MSKRILSVDDSPSMRQMVRLTLATAGYHVGEAGNGAEGLAAAGRDAFDLVITDLNMPVMDGLSFIRALRTLPAYRGVPIIFLTTESDDARKREARQAGATGWITKPFQQDQLLAVAKKVLG